MAPRSGFTLIELSIVLVIIGLVTGAILFGRDLIEAASLRAQLTQIEKYKAAANTFRTKYGFLPGDLPAAEASAVGFFPRAGNFGSGDGNGYVNGPFGLPRPFLRGEPVFFWTDLSAAQLIDGNFTQNTAAAVTATPTQVALYLPPAKIGRGHVLLHGFGEGLSITADLSASESFENNFQLIEFAATSGMQVGVLNGMIQTYGGPLTPLQAQAFDQKSDDGLPTSGTVTLMMGRWTDSGAPPNSSVRRWLAFFGWLAPPGDDCAVDGTPTTYSTADSTKANRSTCSLRIRAGF
jgi:prepilin-type N-terminal cleavage/methylation domain-containing protein